MTSPGFYGVEERVSEVLPWHYGSANQILASTSWSVMKKVVAPAAPQHRPQHQKPAATPEFPFLAKKPVKPLSRDHSAAEKPGKSLSWPLAVIEKSEKALLWPPAMIEKPKTLPRSPAVTEKLMKTLPRHETDSCPTPNEPHYQ